MPPTAEAHLDNPIAFHPSSFVPSYSTPIYLSRSPLTLRLTPSTCDLHELQSALPNGRAGGHGSTVTSSWHLSALTSTYTALDCLQNASPSPCLHPRLHVSFSHTHASHRTRSTTPVMKRGHIPTVNPQGNNPSARSSRNPPEIPAPSRHR